ncbi:hypothetical protein BDZ89DRAFT_1078291 [Hymenopellis radicata]|nr:hypothetical protein BDZ89DRAFT_1078291 [Hymenopellis radicata]
MFSQDSVSPADSPDVLSLPPFVQVQGVFNIRHVGGYSEQLVALGVKHVFDLRSPGEIASYKSATPVIEGVTVSHVPASLQGFDPISLVSRLESFQTNVVDTFVTLNDELLMIASSSFDTIFRHIVDKPDEPCLVHCTAGKDRTGVFFALLLMVLGVSDEDIAKDLCFDDGWSGTFMPILFERFKKQPAYAKNPVGAMNMGSSKPECMLATLNMIREKHGGAEEYLKKNTSLKDEDFNKLRTVLTLAA